MIKIPCSLLLGIGLAFAGWASAAAGAENHLLESPDGRIRVSIEFPAPGSTERPVWSATFLGNQMLTNCNLGLEIRDEGELMKGARLRRERRRSVSKRIPVMFGKAAYANDRFNEIRFELETIAHSKLDVIFRCYNDAVAVRYELPKGEKGSIIVVTGETTSFGICGEPHAYVQYLENYNTSHEHNVIATPARGVTNGALLDLPLTLS